MAMEKQGRSSNAYTAYGDRTPGVDGAHRGYAGELVELGVEGYLLGERLYLPSLRRFACPDPVSPFGAGGFNRYAYCSGDPTNRVDPTGNVSTGWWRALSAGTRLLAGAASAAIAAAPAVARVVVSGVMSVASWSGDVVGRIARRGGRIARAARRSSSIAVEKAMMAGDDFLLNAMGSRVRTTTHRGGEVRIHEGPGWETQRPLRDEPGYAPGLFGLRRVSEYQATWHAIPNSQGATIHLPDTVTTLSDTLRRVDAYIDDMAFRRQMSVNVSDLTVISGGHGRPDGLNWSAEGRWLSADAADDSEGVLAMMVSNEYPALRGLSIRNIATMTLPEYERLL